MFEQLEPEPRGFVGRPFLALVLAVAAGSIAAQLSSCFHLNDLAMSAICVVAIVVVAYAWERLETPRN